MASDPPPSAAETAPLAPASAHTYVAGEDTGRLGRVARDFGLEKQRKSRLMPVRDAVSTLFRAEAALYMHAVSVLGEDERIDNSGTLHYVSVRRRAKKPMHHQDSFWCLLMQ